MTTFRNAYHFVPRGPNNVDAKSRRLPDQQRDFGLRPGHESEGHAIYASDAHSGRITCRITLECPTIIGSQREKGSKKKSTPAKVAPFLFKERPAIPASSLKGMLSLIAESAARAPYRVLRDMQLTVAFAQRDAKDKPRFTVRHKVVEGKSTVIHSPGLTSYRETSRIGSTYTYVDPSLHPMAITGKAIKRAQVNPVESMFGFVAEAEKNQEKPGRDKVNSAAGKLRLSHARLSGDWVDRAVSELYLAGDPTIEINKASPIFGKVPDGVTLTLLKEQGEPMKKPKRQEDHQKPGVSGFDEEHYETLNSATPNFYFIERNLKTRFLNKQHFATNSPSTYSIQGAKFYLHSPESVPDPKTGMTWEPWRTRNPGIAGDGIDRKAAAPILRHGITFDFHIDFDNLTDHELNILCFALRPSERFRHKIGLGKALGLGSIRIDVTDLVLIDRSARYRPEALFDDDPRDLSKGEGKALAAELAARHDRWLAEADRSARTALLAIGETHNFDGRGKERDSHIPVLWVPLTEEKFQSYLDDHPQIEEDSFAWFTLNDASYGPQQKLRPIDGEQIPTLDTIRKPPKKGGGGPKRKW
jgi:CRISPR/Cas system CSM-associated protein Csm3 (group 7 of RAMP superfamily)